MKYSYIMHILNTKNALPAFFRLSKIKSETKCTYFFVILI